MSGFRFLTCVALCCTQMLQTQPLDQKIITNRTHKIDVDTDMSVKTENHKAHATEEEYTFGDHVHVVNDAFFIPQLDKYRKVWIYLPKSYKDSKKAYPVIYMHDGQNLFHAQPPRADEWAVDSVVDSLIKTGAEEMIIVGINHGGKDRLREYNPYNSQYGKGEGKAYALFIAETLKPFIDLHYRTKSDLKNTAIAGSSMGGLISLYTISAYPEVFGSAGVFSPALWLAPKIYEELAKNLTGLKDKKIFVVAGDKEGTAMVRDAKKVYDILNADGKNRNVAFIEREDGKHTEWFWHREFESFYKFIEINRGP